MTGSNWDMNKNVISIETFQAFQLRKENSEIKMEFLDENRRSQFSLVNFNNLCDLRGSIITEGIFDTEKPKR